MHERHSTGFIVPADSQPPPASRPDPHGDASRRRRAVRGERIAVYLPPELVEELRLRCVREKRSVSDAVTEAVSSWMVD